jgi:hypothetical protein
LAVFSYKYVEKPLTELLRKIFVDEVNKSASCGLILPILSVLSNVPPAINQTQQTMKRSRYPDEQMAYALPIGYPKENNGEVL